MLFVACVVLFFALLIVGVPIVLSLGVPCALWFVLSGDTPLMIFSQKLYVSNDSFAMLAVPFFMLAGQIMEKAEITSRIVDFANACVGWIRGGLAQTVEVSGMVLAGLSGSSSADTSALGAICYKPLLKSGYDEGMANAIIVSAGSIGPIIPPSICMIIYANAASLNIGKLFMGGVLPGIIMGLGYMVVCYLYAKRHNVPRTPFAGFLNIGKTFIYAVWALLMPIIILGGILTGVATVTESGILAVVYGICYGFVTRKLNFKILWQCMREAVSASVAPLVLISVSHIFSFMLAREGLITVIGNFCAENITSTTVFLFFVMVMCVFTGCFMDNTATMLMLTPILLPIAQNMGIDVQHFSLVFILSLCTGGMSPPVGSQLFVIQGISGTPITKMVKPVLRFLAVYVGVIILLIFVPWLTTYIPSLVLN